MDEPCMTTLSGAMGFTGQQSTALDHNCHWPAMTVRVELWIIDSAGSATVNVWQSNNLSQHEVPGQMYSQAWGTHT